MPRFISSGRVVNQRSHALVEGDVYIGRGRGSKWGNPFSHEQGTLAEFVVGSRDEAVDCYRRWLWARVKSEGWAFIEELACLHGKTLVCWCHPQRCHGDVLLEAADWAFELTQDDWGATKLKKLIAA